MHKPTNSGGIDVESKPLSEEDEGIYRKRKWLLLTKERTFWERKGDSNLYWGRYPDILRGITTSLFHRGISSVTIPNLYKLVPDDQVITEHATTWYWKR